MYVYGGHGSNVSEMQSLDFSKAAMVMACDFLVILQTGIVPVRVMCVGQVSCKCWCATRGGHEHVGLTLKFLCLSL